MPVDTVQLKSVANKCLQGCQGPRHEKMNGVSNSKITHCAVLISVSVMIARECKYWFWYCIRKNLAIGKYSISNPNQRLSHNSDQLLLFPSFSNPAKMHDSHFHVTNLCKEIPRIVEHLQIQVFSLQGKTGIVYSRTYK